MFGGGYLNPSPAPDGLVIISGTITSGNLGNGVVFSGNIASGQIASGHLASGLIANLGGSLSSGAVGSGHIASGAVFGRALGLAFNIASGSIGTNDLGSGQITSTALAGGRRRMPDHVVVSGTALTSGVLAALACGLASGAPYRIDGGILVDFDGTGGVKLDLGGGTITGPVVAQVYLVGDGSAVLVAGRVTSLTGTFTATPLGPTTGLISIQGTVVPSAAGTLIPRFAQNSANNSNVAGSGSYLMCTQLGN